MFFGKKIIYVSVLSALYACNAYATEVIYKESENKHITLNSFSQPVAISHYIDNLKNKNNLHKIVAYHFSDHYILYLLSNSEWSIKKIRINLDTSGNITTINDPYVESSQELKALAPIEGSSCPDPSVQFVAISAYPGVGHVTRDIQSVYAAARKHYKSVKILGDSANASTYESWLSCPNLKGFYSIGHGDNTLIMVANEEIVDYSFFQNDSLINNYVKTTVVLNSCSAFNSPLGSQISFGNVSSKTGYSQNPGPNAYEYLSGYIGLPIGESEDTSACFMTNAINGEKMDYDNLEKCAANFDFYVHDFGLSKPDQYLS